MPTNPLLEDAEYSSSGLADRKAMLARDAAERATARAEKIAAQASPFTSPLHRIALWEKFHGLSLPQSPTHKLLQVIARQTELSVREVQEEQVRRAAENTSKG
jgi:hypothetical protein